WITARKIRKEHSNLASGRHIDTERSKKGNGDSIAGSQLRAASYESICRLSGAGSAISRCQGHKRSCENFSYSLFNPRRICDLRLTRPWRKRSSPSVDDSWEDSKRFSR